MRFRESSRFAWQGIVANKMRSLLTMLGIVIGVASVITLVAVGTGSNDAVAASINRLGSDTLNVVPVPAGTGGHGSALQSQLRRSLGITAAPQNGTQDHAASLSLADATALTGNPTAPDVAAVAPLVTVRSVVATDGSSSHTVASFVGSTANYLGIDDDTVAAGSAFTDAQNAAHDHVALLGTTVAADLTNGDPSQLVGTTVQFNGRPFTVVGILGSKGYSGQQDLDDKVIAPISAVEDSLYGYGTVGAGQLTSIAVQATSPAAAAAAQNEVQTIIDQLHGYTALNSQLVVYNASSVLAASSQSSHTLTILLAAVAGISLLVGGIGVMNIMLVSVTERTREIGIRKAIGGDRKDIVRQFLTEAVILSMLGGVVGIAFGVLASRFTIAGVQPVVASWSVWLALGVSVATGLVFGFYPAARAAALRPIQALRYE
jgi:putative ABC transport system permease protein